jgi:hypothetical protein
MNMTTTPQPIYHNVSRIYGMPRWQLAMASIASGVHEYVYNAADDTLTLNGKRVPKPKKDKPQQGDLI